MVTGTVRLSDEYTGGELVFPRQKYKNTDVPVGSMLVWPSSIQHLHYSDTLLSGIKYTWVSWTKNERKEPGINYDEI
jgi:predicted 2-oxoglutarate/Fe(II)-dependent dioxygenase YbiX